MTNLYQDTMDAISKIYLAKLEKYAKDNPKFTNSMWCAVYGEMITATEREFIGEGIILTTEWCKEWERHYHSIQLFESGNVLNKVYDRDLVRVCFMRDQSRQFKKSSVVQGGFV